MHLPGPPKEPQIMDQYPKIENIGRQYRVHSFGHFGGPGSLGQALFFAGLGPSGLEVGWRRGLSGSGS